MKTLLLAGAFACMNFLSSPGAAVAADCAFPFDATIGEFSAAGAPPFIIPEAQLPDIVAALEAKGREIGTATRGFIAKAGGKLLLGLEVDGCLLPPIVLGVAAPAPAPLSGKSGGRIGA